MKNLYPLTSGAIAFALDLKKRMIFVALMVAAVFISPASAQTFVSSTQGFAVSGDNTLTISRPTGMSVNDVMIAAIDVRPLSAGITVPSGWKLIILTNSASNPGGGENKQAFYWKAVTSSEPTSYTWSFNTTGGSAGGIMCFSDVDPVNPISTYKGQSTAYSLSHSTPSLTTTVANTTVIAAISFGSSSTWKPVAGWSEEVDVSSKNSDVYGVSLCMNYKTLSQPGTTSLSTASTSNSSNIAEVGVGQILSLKKEVVLPVATISYALANYCISNAAVPVTITGKTGGTFSSTPSGLSINSSTGLITPASSTPGTYTISYTYGGATPATDNVTITGNIGTLSFSAGSSSTRCQGAETITYDADASASANATITYSLDATSTSGGNSINSSTGQVTFAAGWKGTSTITAKATGCDGTKTATHTVTTNAVATISATSTAACPGASTGAITANATGGSTPYTYSLNNTSYQSSNRFNGLSAGNYTVYVKTSTGCVSSTSVTVGQAAAIANNSVDWGGSGVVCGTANENSSLTLTAPAGAVFTSVDFASFGTPGGSCATSFSIGICHSTTSQSVAEQYLLGNNSAVIPATTAVFGSLPWYCSLTSRKLAVEATYVKSVCAGTTPGIITGSTPTGGAGSYTYLWEVSTDGPSTGFAAAPGVNNGKDYTPAALSGTTWFRRTVTSGGCSDVSPVQQISVTPTSAGTISGSTTECSTSNTGTLALAGYTGTVVRWESSVNGTSWTTIANTTASLTYTNLLQTTDFRAVVQSSACAEVSTASARITVAAIGTWTGVTDTLWNVASNWQCGVIPTSSINVIIPSGLRNYPVIKSGVIGKSKDIKIQAGATITVRSGTLQIAGAVNATGSNVIATDGKVEFNGNTAQTVPAGLFYTNTIKDLGVTNAASVTLAGAVRVTGSVGFGDVDFSILKSNGNLTLASTAVNTASVLDITNNGNNKGNGITGDVIVERYTQGKRAYRFLTAPVNSTTDIKANWMEGVSNPTRWDKLDPHPHYGTNISGPDGVNNGFDVTQTTNPSMYTFDVTRGAWAAIPNTKSIFSAGTGYRIMVRGSRDVDLNNNDATPSFTTLRAKGTLVTGPVTFAASGGTAGMPKLSNVPNGYSLIANPYASAVDWIRMFLKSKDLSPTFYIFDPTVSGSNTRGAYVAYNATLKVKNVLTSLANNSIQSGQAFFVQTIGANPAPSLTFDETYKSTDIISLFRTTNETPHVNVELLLPSQVNSTGSADGTAVYFSEDYSNAIANDDSYKFINQDENIAILRNGTALSLEGRKPVEGADSVPLKLWQLSQNAYTLKVTVSDFADNVERYLEDKYLQTAIPLPNGETLVPFNITSDPASAASDRFKITFESFATLPVRLTGIKAYEKNKGVQVDWIAESESNIDLYEVEKSSDAQHFETIGSAKAKNNAAVATAYNFFDIKPFAGDNYYRIKTIEKSGEIKESEIVRVNIAGVDASITLVNNPVNGHTIQLLFNNVEKGNYSVSLVSQVGERISLGTITYAGGTASKQIRMKSYIAKGVYGLQLVNGSVVKTIQVLVQ